jgi:hypothetical protein
MGPSLARERQFGPTTRPSFREAQRDACLPPWRYHLRERRDRAQNVHDGRPFRANPSHDSRPPGDDAWQRARDVPLRPYGALLSFV